MAKWLRAFSVITGRALWYLVSFRWKPKEDYLLYPTAHRFSNSYVVIDYHFRHALWYRFKGIRTTTRSGPLVLNLRHVKQQQVQLTVQGLFRQKHYRLDLRPQANYQHPYASIRFNGFEKTPPLPAAMQLKNNKPCIKQQQPRTRMPRVSHKPQLLLIKHSPYKQSNFI